MERESRFTVEFVPQTLQRYETLDDYFRTEDGILHFIISDTGNINSNRALLLHAMVEESIASVMGVTHDTIDAWDFAHPGSDEPGDEPGCPYAAAHYFAGIAERWLIEVSEISWRQHEKNLERAMR